MNDWEIRKVITQLDKINQIKNGGSHLRTAGVGRYL